MAIDISIDFNKVNNMLNDMDLDPGEKARYWQTLIHDIREAFSRVEEDGLFIHADTITVNGVFQSVPEVELNCKNCGAGVTSPEKCEYCGVIKLKPLPTLPHTPSS